MLIQHNRQQGTIGSCSLSLYKSKQYALYTRCLTHSCEKQREVIDYHLLCSLSVTENVHYLRGSFSDNLYIPKFSRHIGYEGQFAVVFSLRHYINHPPLDRYTRVVISLESWVRSNPKSRILGSRSSKGSPAKGSIRSFHQDFTFLIGNRAVRGL